jgi:hypothetical protein
VARLATIALAVSLAWVGIMMNWWWEYLRTTDTRLDHILMLVACSLPICALVVVWRTPSDTIRAAGTTFLVLGSIVGVAMAVGILALLPEILRSGVDPSFERIRSVAGSRSQLVAYRTDGGATTSFGVVLREERTLLPGLRRIRRVDFVYPASDVIIEIQTNGDMVCTFPPERVGDKSMEVTVHLQL